MTDRSEHLASRSAARGGVCKYIALLVVVGLVVGGWSGFWYYAASRAEAAIAGWRAREAKAGRVYSCGQETIGGFPFRIEVRCDAARAELRGYGPNVEVKTTDVLVAAQIYQPTLLISEFGGPMTVAEIGGAPILVANWKLSQTSVRGTPNEPERVSIVVDGPSVDRVTGSGNEPIIRAGRIELHARMLQ